MHIMHKQCTGRPFVAFLCGFIMSQAMVQGIQGLKVDPSGHFLVTHDGKPFLWQGDTLWGALSLGPADIDY